MIKNNKTKEETKYFFIKLQKCDFLVHAALLEEFLIQRPTNFFLCVPVCKETHPFLKECSQLLKNNNLATNAC